MPPVSLNDDFLGFRGFGNQWVRGCRGEGGRGGGSKIGRRPKGKRQEKRGAGAGGGGSKPPEPPKAAEKIIIDTWHLDSPDCVTDDRHSSLVRAWVSLKKVEFGNPNNIDISALVVSRPNLEQYFSILKITNSTFLEIRKIVFL